MSGTPLLVLLMLATHMDRDGTNGRPSQKTLAAETGLAERTVRRHLADAVDEGWLVQVTRGHRRGDGSLAASCYSTSLPDSPDRLTSQVNRSPQAGSAGLNRPNAASQPAKSDISTGPQRPPTIPYDQKETSDPDLISEEHKAVAADGLRAYREAIGREAS